MKGNNAFLKWLKRPHGVLLTAVYVLSAGICALAIVLAIAGKGNAVLEIVSYVVYAMAAVLLGYSVYTIVLYAPTMKGSLTNCLKRHEFTKKLVERYDFRTLFFSLCSFSLTVAFAVMNLVSGFLYRLSWYFYVSAYYFVLLLFRGGILYADRKCKKKYAENIEEYTDKKWRIYLAGGAFLVLVEFAMAAAVTQMVLSRRPFRSGQIMTIANAAYTFYKMTMAIYNLIKAKRFNDPTIQALRNINFADACMSVTSLTVLMLATFGDGESMMIFKAGVGFAACAAIIAVASRMIIKAHTQLKEKKGKDYAKEQ